jgi:hypothetical protein
VTGTTHCVLASEKKRPKSLAAWSVELGPLIACMCGHWGLAGDHACPGESGTLLQTNADAFCFLVLLFLS